LELRHPKSAKRQVGAQKIKTMDASSGGMIDKGNHQLLELLDAFGHVSHGRGGSYT